MMGKVFNFFHKELHIIFTLVYFQEGPPVAEMMHILGKDETLNRLKYVHGKLKSGE